MTTEIKKRIAIVPFLGGRIEVRNAYSYPERKRQPDGTWVDTGNVRQARAGTFICLPDGDTCDITGLDLDEILSPAICKRIKDHKLAQAILKENMAGQLEG